MVRTRTFDPATALSKAVELFSSKGYSETSMEDIVQAIGVSRYGLYGTFGNNANCLNKRSTVTRTAWASRPSCV